MSFASSLLGLSPPPPQFSHPGAATVTSISCNLVVTQISTTKLKERVLFINHHDPANDFYSKVFIVLIYTCSSCVYSLNLYM